MKKIRVIPIILMVILLVIGTVGVSTSAVSIFFLSNSESLTSALEAANAAVETGLPSEPMFSEAQGGYYFNRSAYEQLTRKNQKLWIKAFVKYINDHPINTADKQVLYNALKEVDDKYITAEISYLLNDTGSSMFTAIRILSPFTSVVGVVLGVASILLITGVVFMTVIDIACLSIPMFAVKANGEKPKYMSKDAFKAYGEAETDGGNVYWLYLKRRFVSYIVLIICVTYLISGSLGDLFMKLVELFNGITELGG